MILDGFGIAGYRSFGEEMVYINDLAKVNVFIGKNNSGKSNILRFCNHLSKIDLGSPYEGFDNKIDYCVDTKDKDIKFAFQIKKDSPAMGGIKYSNLVQVLPMITEMKDIRSYIWFEYSVRKLGQDQDVSSLSNRLKKAMDSGGDILEAIRIHRGITGAVNINQLARQISLDFYRNTNFSFTVNPIDAFRKIAKGESDNSDLNGPGLITKLNRFKAPGLEHYQDKEKFETINDFLRELIGETDAYLDIPSTEDQILVSIKGKVLPLESLGTGIHELIILAAAVTVYENSIFCIEEPEIHIHPELQKKFIKYIQKKNNQYLISTHSNAFFDIPGVNIYHCSLDENEHTKCELVTTDREKGGILLDLGYKPSDLLQSNYIIWVEGPSDRIYLNHWIHGTKEGEELEEGLHYSIMFYGGRLLSHLAFDDPEVKEFIQLCKLNRNAAIIIDRDTESARKRINDTKRRVKRDFEDNGCYVWVTNGREIENYVEESIFNSVVEQAHPRTAKRIKWNQFAVMTKLKQGRPMDKVAVSKKVAEVDPDYSVLDLDKKIEELIKYIKKANS